MHYEVEVVARINKLGKGISARFAHRYFNEVTVGIDLTARDLQNKLSRAGLPWEISKCFDGAAPLGKFVPVSSIKNINDIEFSLQINGRVVQQSSTSDMIFSLSEIIAYVSRFFTLKTGDLIFTGTPSGVGVIKKNDHLVAFLEEKPLLNFMIK
jgi:2-keto-4-pentenoate hydratase/2-oxohepta-3-ene-1,7-dioic acid hydratase in catechol pathway